VTPPAVKDNGFPHGEMTTKNAVEGCWAACLGDCEGGLSGEHTISKCLFSAEAVKVRGFHWCLDEPITVGLSSLTRNILCKKHNSDLSDVDAYSKTALNTLADSMALAVRRNELRQNHWTIKRYEIDGRLFERWFVKTLVNVAFGGRYGIGRGAQIAGIPSDNLVRIAFGQQSFHGHAGLYALARNGENISLQEGIKIVTMLEDSNIVMARFSFCGYGYLLSLIPEKYAHHEESMMLHQTHRQYLQVYDKRGRKVRSHIVQFKW
jgi:hypothetical protein